MNAIPQQVHLIRTLLDAAERHGIPLWLEGGWAIDARLGRITRAHEDIDIAFAAEHEAAYRDLIHMLGCDRHEEMDYGFLSWRDDVLLDSEPCVLRDGEYNFEDFPGGSCPMEKEGVIDGYRVRCLSWEALYVEFLGYMDEVPQDQWRAKDFESLQLIEAHLDQTTKQALRDQYERAA